MDFINKLIQLKIIPFLERRNLLRLTLVIIDVLAIAIAFQIAFMINYHGEGAIFFFERKDLTLLFLAILPLWLITLYIINATEIPRTKKYTTLILEYIQSAITISIILMILYFVFKLGYLSRLFLIQFAFLGFLFLLLARIIEYKVFKVYRAKGFNYVNLILIADETAIPFIEEIRQNIEWDTGLHSCLPVPFSCRKNMAGYTSCSLKNPRW